MEGSPITLTIDGETVAGLEGQTILELADKAGIYIPRLCCNRDDMINGTCRICSVMVDGAYRMACVHPAVDGMVVENNTERVQTYRQTVCPPDIPW